LTEQIAAADKLLSGTVLYPDILLFSILSRAAMHSQYKQREQQSNLSIMKALLDEFDDWTASYAENHYARMLLAKAAFRHCEQPNERLDHWYNEAIDSAACSGQIQMAALANLLAARYHDKESRLANFYAIEAEHYYAQWGADTISAMIRREFALAGAGVQSEPSNKAPNPKEFPYQKEVPYQEKAPHQKEAPHQKGAPYQEEIPSPGTLNEPLMIDPGSLGEAQRFTYLLDALSKQSRATYAAVLFEKSDRMFLKYEKDFGDAVTCHEELININHVSHLSRRIVRYVARTGEDFMLSENSSRDVVAFDPYILSGESISIVCVPFRQEGILAGLLYFEKKGSDYFEPHFVAQIKSMVSLLILNRPYRDEKTSKAPLPVHAASQLLTGRELDVLALLAEGMSNSEISQNLFITLGTVKNHLSNIYGKLEVESRVQAVIRAKELGIIAD
jgi:DNA-binding CsgD family transcriptional regulator